LFIVFKGICDPHADFEIYMLLFALTQKVTKKVKTGSFC